MIYNLFISEIEVKNTVPMSTNIDIKQLRTIILQTQIQYITPLICQALYDELSTQIETNTVTVLNQALLDHIKPMLAWFTYYEFLPFNWAKMREQSEVLQNTQFGTPVSQNDLVYIRGNALDFANRLMIEFQRWLNKNKADYPLYSNCCDVCKCNPCGCNSDETKLTTPWFVV